jgi:hypothetical protein
MPSPEDWAGRFDDIVRVGPPGRNPTARLEASVQTWAEAHGR